MQIKHILSDIKNKNFCRIRGKLQLTKTQSNFSDILLFRDRDLENQTRLWINEKTDFENIFSRYQSYEPQLKSFDWPQHFPVRILSGTGSACSGENIFMFFPNVIQQSATNENDVFGLEFIDIWSNIFKSVIFPIASRIFNKDTLIQLLSLQRNLEKTIYLAAVFHEIGHRCGPYRISPNKDTNLKIDSYYLDVLGELSTDALLIKNLNEFPEVMHFVLLQRLFWFGRKGFRHNPLSADVNTDNDCWLGSMIWQELINNKALQKINHKYQINFDSAKTSFLNIIPEIDALIDKDQEQEKQNQILKSWMKKKVRNENNTFLLPESFKILLESLQDVPETPHFQTPYSYECIEELTGVIKNEQI